MMEDKTDWATVWFGITFILLILIAVLFYQWGNGLKEEYQKGYKAGQKNGTNIPKEYFNVTTILDSAQKMTLTDHDYIITFFENREETCTSIQGERFCLVSRSRSLTLYPNGTWTASWRDS